MLTIIRDAQLKSLNTMGLDGTVCAVALWDTAIDLHSLFNDEVYCSLMQRRVKAIGEGSNLLFVNNHVDAILLKCNDSQVETVADDGVDVTLRVHAGCHLDNFVELTCERGLWGAENLSLIPGTTGGATVQNVGAYGTEWGDMVAAVCCYDRCYDREVTIPRRDMAYGYRDSALKHEPWSDRMIVISTDIVLSRKTSPKLSYGNLRRVLEHLGDKITPSDVRRAIIDTRRAKLPEVGVTGSAGSFFKNPVVSPEIYTLICDRAERLGIDVLAMPAHETLDSNGNKAIKLSAAWLMDRAGWKGYTRGNAGTWPDQPLVLVNLTGCATGAEIASLASDIIEDVETKWGVTLTPEVEYL